MRKLLPALLSALIAAPVAAQPALTNDELIVLETVNLLQETSAWYPERGDVTRPIFERLAVLQARAACIRLNNRTATYEQLRVEVTRGRDRDIALHNLAATLAGIVVLCPQHANQLPVNR